MDMTNKTVEEVYAHFLTLKGEKNGKENYYLIQDFALALTQHNNILFQDALEIANVYLRGWEPHGIVKHVLEHNMRAALLECSQSPRDMHALFRVMESVFPRDVMDNANSAEGFRKARNARYNEILKR